MNFYKEDLLDHYKNPRNYGELNEDCISSLEYNPSCGDKVQIHAIISDDIITKLNFTGKGCVISQAMASILVSFCEGKLLSEVSLLDEKKVLSMIEFQLGPNRAKCALLSLMALQGVLKLNI